MRLARIVWGMFPLAAMALGCEGSTESAAPVASASAALAPQVPSAAPSTSAARPHRRFGRHGGLAAGLFRGAHDLDLTPAQQGSLDKIESSLDAGDDGLRAAMKTFRGDLAAGVEAGKLDTAKLTSDGAAIDEAVADHEEKQAAALDSLHALLDPAERKKLVGDLEAKQAEREAHAAAWMKAREADAGAIDWGKRRLDRLTAELSLDAAQQKQVAAILARASELPKSDAMQARRDERKKRTEALLASFEGDAFEAAKVDLSDLPGKTPHEPMTHVTAFFSKLLGVLRPDQRDKLAATLHRPFGGMGPHAGPAPAHDPADDITFPFAEPPDGPRD